VTPEGVADDFLTATPKTGTGPQHRLLYIGSLYPHKNIQVVLEALQQDPQLRLDLVGSRNVFQKKVLLQTKRLGIADRVQFLGTVADKQLVESFHSYTALIQPSLSEGFGLTGLEAMSAGLPVIASNIPVFREVYATAATYFDPMHPEALLAAYNTVTNPKVRAQLIQLGKENAQKYSWKKMTSQIMSEYLKVFESQ